MKLTILGSGVMFPTKERFPSAFLIEIKETKILFDCGHETIARLVKLGVDPREIDGIFISHFHPDHFGDAFNLVISCSVGNGYQKKDNLKLVFWGPEGLQERYKKWREIYWPEPDEEYPLEFFEGPGKYSFNGIEFEIFPIYHVPWFKSVGIRLKANDKTLVFPGDVGSVHNFENLVREVGGADLMLIESGYPNPTANHFTLEQAKDLALKAGVKKTIIVHIQPVESEIQRIKDFVKENEGFVMGEDGMRIEI
jgi:ribonuclease BN (tRNA processing enzyme)